MPQTKLSFRQTFFTFWFLKFNDMQWFDIFFSPLETCHYSLFSYFEVAFHPVAFKLLQPPFYHLALFLFIYLEILLRYVFSFPILCCSLFFIFCVRFTLIRFTTSCSQLTSDRRPMYENGSQQLKSNWRPWEDYFLTKIIELHNCFLSASQVAIPQEPPFFCVSCQHGRR